MGTWIVPPFDPLELDVDGTRKWPAPDQDYDDPIEVSMAEWRERQMKPETESLLAALVCFLDDTTMKNGDVRRALDDSDLQNWLKRMREQGRTRRPYFYRPKEALNRS